VQRLLKHVDFFVVNGKVTRCRATQRVILNDTSQIFGCPSDRPITLVPGRKGIAPAELRSVACVLPIRSG